MSLLYEKNGISFKNIYIFSKTLHQRTYEQLKLVLSKVPEIKVFLYSDVDSVPDIKDCLPFSVFIFDDVIVSESQRNVCLRQFYSMARYCDESCEIESITVR